MKSRFVRSLVFAATVFAFTGCGSLRKADDEDEDTYTSFSKEPRGFGEKVSAWWDRSREREQKTFDRMFDRATN